MNPRDRRALNAGVAVAGGAVLLLRMAPWGWHALTSERDRLQAREVRLEYMRAEVARASTLEDSGKVVRAGMARLAPGILSASTSGQASTELGALLTVAAERVRVAVRRTDVVPDSTVAGPARRVLLRASLESDTRGMLDLLRALAGTSQVVGAERIQIAADEPSDRGSPELLHTELTVSGWYLPKAVRR